MIKIIILPNKKICPYGKFFKINNFFEKFNLCNFLLDNNIFINNNCGGFGKCLSCLIFLNEGVYAQEVLNINFKYFFKECLNISNFKLSCQFFIKSSIIINIFNY